EGVSFEARSFSGSVWWMRHKLDSLFHIFQSMVAQAVQLVLSVCVGVKSASRRAAEGVSFEARSFSGSVWWMRHKLDSLCHFF
ncbi:MAG: hypothetical protein ACKVX9_15445, partial [Blastocatellia bacterium]